MKNISKEELLEKIKEKELTYCVDKPQAKPRFPLNCKDDSIVYTVDQLVSILNSQSADELRELVNQNHFAQIGAVLSKFGDTHDAELALETAVHDYHYSFTITLKLLHTYSKIKKRLQTEDVASLQSEWDNAIPYFLRHWEHFQYVQVDIAHEWRPYDDTFDITEVVKSIDLLSTPKDVQHKMVYYLMCNMIYSLVSYIDFAGGFLLRDNPQPTAVVMSELLKEQVYPVLKGLIGEKLIEFLSEEKKSRKRRKKVVYYFTFKECNDRLDEILILCFKALHYICFGVSTFCNNEFIIN